MSSDTGPNAQTGERDAHRAEMMNRIDELLKRMLHMREMHGHIDSWLMAGEMHWFAATCEKLINLYTAEQRRLAQQIDDLANQLKADEQQKRDIFTARPQ